MQPQTSPSRNDWPIGTEMLALAVAVPKKLVETDCVPTIASTASTIAYAGPINAPRATQ